MVTWMGAPGREHVPSQPEGIEHGPAWFDAEGQRRYQIWRLRVHVGGPDAPKAVIAEPGGVA